MMPTNAERGAPHIPFALVLGGGGARGFAHAGVLRGLEAEELRPLAVVGVSMGAVVGVAYAQRRDWYEALLAMDLSEFPGPTVAASGGSRRGSDGRKGEGAARRSPLASPRRMLAYLRVLKEMVGGWGPGEPAREAGLAELHKLVGPSVLEAGRIPVAVSATDLYTGRRVVTRRGRAVDAVYASAALAGVLPPLEIDGRLLADGAYTDLAPVDVAREMVEDMGGMVIAVDPGQPAEGVRIRNGLQAIMRAMEICHRRHADLRFGQADFVLRPRFERAVDTLDFRSRRDCIAAGIRAVRRRRSDLTRMLSVASRS